ncbi:zinc ribbon domain-containing protein [Thomasclavelia sp.]
MKQCPYCKKNVPDSAKVCPHCGNRLEKGYKPMKRTNAFPNSLYIILAIFLIFSPMISTMLFGSLLGESLSTENVVNTPKDAITLGPLGKADIKNEQTEYYFGSLSDFKKLVTNSDKYVDKIEKFESDLKELVDKYEKTKLKKEYGFYVTDQNNVYSELSYQLNTDNNEITIDLSYDLSGKTNGVNISQSTTGLKDFESLKIKEDSYPLFKEIITLINDDKDFKSFNEAGKKFNDLENSFKERSDSLGNYGIGVSASADDSKTSMRVLSASEGYRFKIIYRAKANLDKLV